MGKNADLGTPEGTLRVYSKVILRKKPPSLKSGPQPATLPNQSIRAPPVHGGPLIQRPALPWHPANRRPARFMAEHRRFRLLFAVFLSGAVFCPNVRADHDGTFARKAPTAPALIVYGTTNEKVANAEAARLLQQALRRREHNIRRNPKLYRFQPLK